MDELNDKFKKSAENFSLIPSTSIWQNVEADIRKRERKRRFIIFIFIGAVIITGGIFLYNNHSTISNKQTELENNNPTTTKQNVQQNIPSENNNPANENNSVPQSFTEKSNQNSYNKTAPQNKPTVNSVSSSTDSNVSSSVTQINFNQNNLVTNHTVQNEISTSNTAIILPVLTDSVQPDSTFESTKDTLQAETKKGSLLEAKSDTIKTDSLIGKKDTIKTVLHQSKWSVSIGAAPTLSFTNQQEEGDYQITSNYRDSSDKNLLTWDYHLAINYQFIPEWEIFTGIGIINFEQELLSKQAVYHYDTIITQVSGPNGPDTIVTFGKSYFNINGDSRGTVKNKFSYFEIPVGIRYNLLPNHKFNISLQPGISFNKLTHSEGYIYNSQNFTYEKIKSSDLKTWLVSYGVGLSFQYAILENLHFEFTPYYKSFQKSIYSDAYPISQRFQQTEFRLSLRYLIK